MNAVPQTPEWSPSSWTSRPAQQQPSYRDPVALARAVDALGRLPPIVVSWEVEALKRQIAEAQRGERFLLQGGDCAESFADCDSGQIARKLKILLQMSLVLLHGMKKPVIRVGRFAGQYAKPRSTDTETRDGVTLPCYRGDLVNRPGFTAAEREPDPELLLRGYERAALTLNFVRALIDGGFADLHHPEYWDLGFVKHSPLADQYRQIASSIADSLDFFEAMSGSRVHEASRAPFYASHEALHLLYEQAQTRFIPRSERWYNLSTHLPWIGMRTADLGGAHVEYCRGISNPVGVKVGPSMDAAWVQGLVHTLNPDKEAGRLVLIHRMGAKHVDGETARPDRIRARDRRAGAVGLRPDARQHRIDGVGRQDAPLREHPGGTRSRVRGAPRDGQLPRRRALRTHGRRRHRVHRRRPRPRGCRPRQGLPLAGRPAAQLRAGPRARDADRDRCPFGLTWSVKRTPARCQHGLGLGPRDLAPLTRGESVERPRSHCPANQSQRRQADRRRHPPHLPVAALAQFELDPGGGNRLAAADRRVARPQPAGSGISRGWSRAGRPVAEDQASSQGLERLVAWGRPRPAPGNVSRAANPAG